MTAHADHKFSVVVHSDDLAVINCMRALSKFSQKTGNNNIPWGGTKDKDWVTNSNEVTFHFSESVYREGFVCELKRLLPNTLWKIVKMRDDEPARRAR